MWGLLPFLLLDSDMEIPEEHVLRIFSPTPPPPFFFFIINSKNVSFVFPDSYIWKIWGMLVGNGYQFVSVQNHL